jgi:hypothetical protein
MFIRVSVHDAFLPRLKFLSRISKKKFNSKWIVFWAAYALIIHYKPACIHIGDCCHTGAHSFLARLTLPFGSGELLPSLGVRRRRPSSVVRRKLFQKSSPLKVLDQWKPNLVWIITRVSSLKIVSGDAVHQPTWPMLLKIEHMVKLQVLSNNSKTVNNIKNLIWGKNDQHIKIYLSCNFEVNLNTHLGVIALYSSNL